jgi:3-hydroxyacyl-CoA dehydrogenase
MLVIRKAAVIGAGNMGAQIAAHLANVGIPSLLMDVIPKELLPEEAKRGLTLQTSIVRNRLTENLFDRTKKLAPAPFFLPEAANLITIGNVEDNWPDIGKVDWIIEAVPERMELKEAIHAKISTYARPDALVTTNTSGLSISSMSCKLPAARRLRFFGAHFFNPPRHMHLLELISSSETDSDLIKAFAGFGETVLGKGIVHAKDTPGFVANRIGCFDMQHAALAMLRHGLTIDEVDALTGPVLGRPRSATFRLADIVGIDVHTSLSRNLHELLSTDPKAEVFRPQDFMEAMVERGWLGAKTGGGFYKRVKTDKGSEILTLAHKTMEYRPQQKPCFQSVTEAAKSCVLGERLRTLCSAPDKGGMFAWDHLSAVLCYAAGRLTEISHDIPTVDKAMRWGYKWELGPFEIWDAIGVREIVTRLEKEAREVPGVVCDLLSSGKASFYQQHNGSRAFFALSDHRYEVESESPKVIHLPRLNKANKTVLSSSGANLMDLDDGVACLDFQPQRGTAGDDQLEMLGHSLEEVGKNFIGLIIANHGQHFAGQPNLPLLAAQIQNQQWNEIESGLQRFQRAVSTLREFEKPVVAACQGSTLGSAFELSLGCDHIVIAAETCFGLTEATVGLVPSGHGTKEMLVRCTETVMGSDDSDFFPAVRHAWETISLGKVSSSAAEAVKERYVRPDETSVVMNEEWILGAAKAQLLQRSSQGYRPRLPRSGIPALGEPALALFKVMLQQMRAGGQITEHDQKIRTKLAYILCGGDLNSLHPVSEQYILDLEREAFLSLCGEPKTLERIKHALQTGKPLRN